MAPPGSSSRPGRILYDLQAYSFSPHGGIARIFDALAAAIEGSEGRWEGWLYHDVPLHRHPPLSAGIRLHPGSRHGGAGGRMRTLPGLARMLDVAERIRDRGFKADLFHPSFYPASDRFAHLPAVVHIYDLLHERVPGADDMPDHGAFLAAKRRWIERAAVLICISEATRSELLEIYDPDPKRVRVIPLGYERRFLEPPTTTAREVRAGAGDASDRPFLLYLGSRQRYKNFHRLALAYARWPGSREVDLVVVGAPVGHHDRTVLDLCGHPPGIRFLGPVNDDALNALYREAAGFVYPSLYEGFGIPLLEAMACRCPILASDIPAFREVAGPQALYADPLRMESLLDGLDRLMACKADPKGEAGRTERLTRYSWDACATAILEEYTAVLETLTS